MLDFAMKVAQQAEAVDEADSAVLRVKAGSTAYRRGGATPYQSAEA